MSPSKGFRPPDENLVLLRQLLESLAVLKDIDARSVSGVRARRLCTEIQEAIDHLRVLRSGLDPIRQPKRVFDPSSAKQLARLIADAMLQQPLEPLDGVERFYGSGVYALYYDGPFKAYQLIKGAEHPIYVGEVDPADPDAGTAEEQGTGLSRRLREHAKSISRAENLDIRDFSYRCIVVKSAWQMMAEQILIRRFRPVWNKEMRICPGFGKHGDDPETRANKRSAWDTLHLGRNWATKDGNKPNSRTSEQISARIRGHLAQYTVSLGSEDTSNKDPGPS